MLWLYLLGAVTVLVIALRRVMRRKIELSDELYSTKIAFDHLRSGVAWVRGDGCLAKVNASLAATLGLDAKNLVDRGWLEMFPVDEAERLRESYARMLLSGMTELEASGKRSDGTCAKLNVRLVPVHDHKMRFVGHHCLVLDSTRTRILEERVKELEMEALRASR